MYCKIPSDFFLERAKLISKSAHAPPAITENCCVVYRASLREEITALVYLLTFQFLFVLLVS